MTHFFGMSQGDRSGKGPVIANTEISFINKNVFRELSSGRHCCFCNINNQDKASCIIRIQED